MSKENSTSGDAVQAILKDEIKQLPLIPLVAVKLLALTNDEQVGMEEIAHIIETEPALAAKILRYVNSPLYGLTSTVNSIQQATGLLGIATVRELALEVVFYDQFIRNKTAQRFDTLFFWQHCLFVALLSKRIAIALQYANPDIVYAAGLIHDIGKLVLEYYGRISYSDFISTLDNSEIIVVENERRFFGATHVEVGQYFCQEWQLPDVIVATAACHHRQPDNSSPFAAFKLETAIVSFANYISWMQGISSVLHEGNPGLQQAVLETIDIDRLDMEALLQQVDGDMQKTREFYGIQFPSISKLRATLVETAIRLSQSGSSSAGLPNPVKNKWLNSLTVPHRSLDPGQFVPATLAAIRTELAFDRCMMLTIDPKQRSLVVAYCWPAEMRVDLDIHIDQASGDLVNCLREKKAALIDSNNRQNKSLLRQLGVTELLMVPVLNQKRLTGLLCADNTLSHDPLQLETLQEIIPIAHELGIALFNASQYEIQKKCAQLDPLTQLFNKRMIETYLGQVFKTDGPSPAKVAIGFIDIDRFKLFNDRCGHQAGDDVLRIVADILRSLTRPGDFIGRYGGEEFLFVLNNTDPPGAYGYAERLRLEIERRGKLMSRRFRGHALTVSIGVAMYLPRYQTYQDMMAAADQAMYQAKHNGRNQVVMLASPAERKPAAKPE